MKRFLLLLLHEIRLVRATPLFHAVAIFQPVLMYALMTSILVYPTFDMNVHLPVDGTGEELVAAMREVGSPIGLPYINPILVNSDTPRNVNQVVVVENRQGVLTAEQRYNLIDANLVKNFRNRLTAAAMRLWNENLGARAVRVVEYPDRPWDVPYNVYFGLAMLPMATFMAAVLLGGVLTTQEFESGIVLEQRMASASPLLILAARLIRLAVTALIGPGLILIADGWITGYWPDSAGLVLLGLLPVAIIGSCLGMIVGQLTRATLPTFQFALITSFAGWILGSGFKPAVSVGGWYAFFSRFFPNAYAVELLFPRFYGVEIGSIPGAGSILAGASLVMIILAALVARRVRAAQR